MAFGAIVGAAQLVRCVRWPRAVVSADLLWMFNNPYVEGPMCWILEDVQRFRHAIPYRGERGLFDVPDSVVGRALGE